MADVGSLLGGLGVGGNIGKAIVQLELDTKKYAAEMQTAETRTKTSTSRMGSTFSAFGGIAKTALLGAGVAVVAFAAYSVKAAIEAQAAMTRLENTLQNNATLSDVTKESFIAQADALRDLTGVDDEAIITMQALLGQFKITGRQVQELTPLVVDLSEKMGIDLAAAAKSVGKAVIGNTAGLQRYGIVISEAEGAGSKFDATLQGLEETVGGFAKAQAAEEPWRVLGAQFEEVAETLGEELLPVIQELTETLIDGMPVIERFMERLLQLKNIFADLAQISFAPQTVPGDAFRELGGQLDELNIKFPELDRALEANRAKSDLAAAGFAGLTGAAEKVRRGLEGVGIGVDSAGRHIDRFAKMTAEELHEWQVDVGKSFDEFVFSLEEGEEQTRVTRLEFMQATRLMERNARELGEAMKELASESMEWVPEPYIDFLSTLGPEWMIGFANLTEEQQHRAVEAWRGSRQETDKSKESLEDVSAALREIEKTDAKGTVTIEYKYVGFDPTKPGMGGASGGPTGRTQRP